MKKILILLCISLLSFTTNAGSHHPHAIKTIQTKTTIVYICNSSSAYAYHSSETCKGLNRCTHGVLKVSLTDAVNKYNRKPCKICYGK